MNPASCAWKSWAAHHVTQRKIVAGLNWVPSFPTLYQVVETWIGRRCSTHLRTPPDSRNASFTQPLACSLDMADGDLQGLTRKVSFLHPVGIIILKSRLCLRRQKLRVSYLTGICQEVVRGGYLLPKIVVSCTEGPRGGFRGLRGAYGQSNSPRW